MGDKQAYGNSGSINYWIKILMIIVVTALLLSVLLLSEVNESEGILPFIICTYYIGFLHALNVWKYDTKSMDSIIYRTLFVTLSIIMSIFIIPYALITVKKDGWIT